MATQVLDSEYALASAIRDAANADCPKQLAEALHYAVFPGGARVRPRLCLAVALANGNSEPQLASAAAAAVELLHCASLVHDDLPCFDDATTRRGKPSVHASFGERIAVLTGDALIVAAFQYLARTPLSGATPARLAAVTLEVARGVGAPSGICAGQAWECEPHIDLMRYHRAKTGALFVASTCAGAVAAGADPGLWRTLGTSIGEAYQVADDILDAVSAPELVGKPTGVDARLGRPSAVAELGLDGAIKRLEACIESGLGSIPPCSGRDALLAVVQKQSERFFPPGVKRSAA